MQTTSANMACGEIFLLLVFGFVHTIRVSTRDQVAPDPFNHMRLRMIGKRDTSLSLDLMYGGLMFRSTFFATNRSDIVLQILPSKSRVLDLRPLNP